MDMKLKIPLPANPVGPQPIQHVPTAYELALKVILSQDARQGSHARCIAHAVGVWPA